MTHPLVVVAEKGEVDENMFDFEEEASSRDEHIFRSLKLCFFRWNFSRCNALAEKYFKKYIEGIRQNPALDEVLDVVATSWDYRARGLEYPSEDESDERKQQTRKVPNSRKPVQNKKKSSEKKERTRNQRSRERTGNISQGNCN